MHSRAARRTVWRMTLRVAGAIPGAYALTAAAVAVIPVALARCGMARAEAVALCAMLGFVLYLVLLLWGFAVRSVARLWATLAGGSAALALLWLIVR